MALNKAKKSEIVGEIGQLLADSKLTVVANYSGTSVKAMQTLRSQALESGTQVRVVKNRLVKKALEANDTFKDLEFGGLNGQLMYVFNSQDEVAPAQVLAKFAVDEPQIEFVSGLTADGRWLDQAELAELASLPSKDQLRAILIGTLQAPFSGLANVLAGNVRGLLNVLSARAEQNV